MSSIFSRALEVFRKLLSMGLPENIRKFRKRLGFTQEDLAKETHTHQTHISRWERGDVKPDVESLEVIATALKVKVSDLIEEPEDPIDRLWASLPASMREAIAAAVEDPAHRSNLERWLQVYHEASPERRLAIMTLLRGENGRRDGF